MIVSSSYYRDSNGFIYKKATSNETTIYLNCLRQPDCLVSMRYSKQTKEAKLLGNHSDLPPDDHVFYKIAFEAHMKEKVKDSKNAHITPLNLYKNALRLEFKGIWLPDGHKSQFLEKLRRTKKYYKTKVPLRKRVYSVDVSTSPIEFVDKNCSLLQVEKVVILPKTINQESAMPGKMPSMKLAEDDLIDFSTPPQSFARSSENNKVTNFVHGKHLVTSLMDQQEFYTPDKMVRSLLKL